MARGKKKVEGSSIDDRIVAVSAEIDSLKVQLHEKRTEMKALQQEKKDADNARLIKAVEDSDKSIDEVIAWLTPEAPQQ